jgi:predicted DNA-binding transcriptional regulator AlpA
MTDAQRILQEIQELRKAILSPPKRLLSVEEAAHYCGIAPKTLRNCLGPKATKSFPVKPVKMAGRVLFRREDLDSYIDGLGVAE